MQHTFKRIDRLITPKDYQYVFNSAYKSSDKFFLILGRVNQHKHSRLGLAISKKSLKLAVSRNTIKRLVRETFRTHQTIEGNNIDFVVMARNNIIQYDNPKLISSLQRNFDKIINHFDQPLTQ